MKINSRLVLILLLLLFFAGCVSQDLNPDITVINLNPDGFLEDIVGNFDVYTGSFQVANPTNRTIENVVVDITLIPTATYCHGMTKTYNFPRIYPSEKKTVEISIAEFGDLGCRYDYSYQVFT
jgi:hypothetical protein